MATRNISLTAEQDASIDRIGGASARTRAKPCVMPCACCSNGGERMR
jgi:hypothetical protein